MPAAAVIPAPIAYIKVVAVRKLVVGFRDGNWLLTQHKFGVLHVKRKGNKINKLYDTYLSHRGSVVLP